MSALKPPSARSVWPTGRIVDTEPGPVRIGSAPFTVRIRGLVVKGHHDQPLDARLIDVIVVDGTRFAREVRP